MLYTKLVALTAGEVKWRTLIWKGNSRKAPEIPPIDVNADTKKATRGGIISHVSTPEIAKWQ